MNTVEPDFILRVLKLSAVTKYSVLGQRFGRMCKAVEVILSSLGILTLLYFHRRCCNANCEKKVIQSKALKLESKCEGKLCNHIISTKWSIRVFHLTINGHGWSRMIKKYTQSSNRTRSSFVVKDFSSRDFPTKARNPLYKIKAVIFIRVKNDVIEEEYEKKFVVNSPPFNAGDNSSGCFVTPKEGFAVETTFNITCVGWRDEDEPLTYEFRYNTSAGLVINNPGIGINTLSTNLPVGGIHDDFEFPVDIYIKDYLGDLTIGHVEVKVGENAFYTCTLSHNYLREFDNIEII